MKPEKYVVVVHGERYKYLNPKAPNALSDTPYFYEDYRTAHRSLGWSPYLGKIVKVEESNK